MAIPDFQSMMLPLLRFFSDEKPHVRQELENFVIGYFQITEDEQRVILPSGRQELFANRTGWAKSYLNKAMLIEKVNRGIYKITQRGLDVLANPPEKITIAYLRQYPEFILFRDVNGSKEPTDREQGVLNLDEISLTPDEQVQKAYDDLHKQLAIDLLEKLKGSKPAFFEKMVVDLLVAMGYGSSHEDAARVVGKSGDGGIDGIISEDRLGLEAIYVQAKRWQGSVGDKEIRDFIGALSIRGARKGVFITTSEFTANAYETAKANPANKIVLLNGEKLSLLMIEHNVGVVVKSRYEIKEIDKNYFGDDD